MSSIVLRKSAIASAVRDAVDSGNHALDDSGIELRCPRCLGSLTNSGRRVVCCACGSEYSLDDGIFDLRCQRRDYYFNPVPRDEMAGLLRDAPESDWDRTVRRFLRFVRNESEWIDNLAVDGRYTWKLMLELPPGARFLDFGCGLGNLVHNLAPHIAETVALDLTWERLQFARERFARFNPNDRITLIAGGDGRSLPFPDGYFDCIALSGVLEWLADDEFSTGEGLSRFSRGLRMLGSFFGETNPRKVQLKALKELRRILKPSGQLFVAIENRWNYEYFKGRPDHHSGLLYGSLLPRFAANAYSILRARRPYRTYTYSYPGLRRLFRDAGLPHQEVYGLSPGYTGLDEVIPAKTDQNFWRPAKADRMADRFRRHPYLVPAFGILARSSASAPTSLLARILADISAKLGVGPISISRCVVTGKEKVVLSAQLDGAGVVIKIASNEVAIAEERRNRDVLLYLVQHAKQASVVPTPLLFGCYQNIHYFVETSVVGKQLRTELSGASRPDAADMVSQFLMQLHPSAEISLHSGALHEALIGEAFDQLRKTGMDTALLEQARRTISERLVSQSLPIGLMHGDFSFDNLFTSAGQITGVVDWGGSSCEGVPVIDIVSYLEGNQRGFDPRSTVSENFIRLAKFDWPSQAELDAVERVYRHFGLKPEVHESICHFAWLVHVGQQLRTTLRLNTTRIDTHIRPMLEHLAAD